MGTNLAWPAYPLFTPRLSVFGLIQAIHISTTLPISNHQYVKWLDNIEIGIHPPQPSPHTHFRVTRVMKISAPGPYVSHQDWVCTDWFSHFISAPPFQSLINSIMNGIRQRLRLEFGLSNGRYNPFSSHEWVQIWLGPNPLFAPRLSMFGLIQAIHSISTLPIFHH